MDTKVYRGIISTCFVAFVSILSMMTKGTKRYFGSIIHLLFFSPVIFSFFPIKQTIWKIRKYDKRRLKSSYS